MIKTHIVSDYYKHHSKHGSRTMDRAIRRLNEWCARNSIKDEQIIQIQSGWWNLSSWPEPWIRIFYKSTEE